MSRKKSIVILSITAIFIVLMSVFAVVSFPIGDTIYDYTGYAKTIKLGLDLKGGVLAVYEVEEDGLGDLSARITGTVDSLQNLLVKKGYTEALVSNSGKQIRVEVPDVDDPERIFTLIAKPASLEIRDAETDGKVLLTGKKDIESAAVIVYEGEYAVSLTFNETGTTKFASATETTGNTLYFFVNNELYTKVTVQAHITNGKTVITRSGGYTYDDAHDFVTQIQAGSFSVSLHILQTSTISATIGKDAITTSLIAGAIGMLIIFIFMAIVYRMLGVMADIALSIYVIILLWFCAVLPFVQLTLPGIAGILLGIGMAVDANTIIFERVREEYSKSSKSISTSVKNGFKRSLAAILDGNVTTLIAAIVLWIVGSDAIVGFAIVLFMSILISVFCSLIVTRFLVKALLAFNSTNPKLFNLKRGPGFEDFDDEDEIVEEGVVNEK